MAKRTRVNPKLTLKKILGKWWIIEGDQRYGPYDTKPEAETAKSGILRFYTEECDKPPTSPSYIAKAKAEAAGPVKIGRRV